LEAQHPYLTDQHTSPHSAPTVLLTPVEQLDLSTVLKVSQAVQGETDLETLIAAVMRLGLEHAGAERGLLILPHGDGYRIEAEASSSNDKVTVQLRQTNIEAGHLPQSVLQYVLRTRTRVLLQDASVSNGFGDDEYLRTHHARSVLCIPLLKQARLTGIFYLENNLTPGAFTPGRMALIEVLASEAAISLENVRLYRDLQERESRIRRLVDANIIGIAIWHTDGRILDANDSFLRIVGLDREDVTSGRVSWFDLTPAEWHDRDARALAEVKAVGAVQPYEKEYIRKNGARVPVLVGGAIFENAPDEGMAFVVDLTERKRTEEALRESERELRLLVDSIPALVWRGSPEGELEYLNARAVEYLGHAAQSLTGGRWMELVDPDDRDATVRRWLQSVTTGSSYRDVYRIRRADGEYRWIQSVGEPYYDGD